MTKPVPIAFDLQGINVPLEDLLPLRQVRPALRSSQKYQQVLSSVREVGIIEPLVVFPQTGQPNKFLLLDGHVRLEVLRQLGETQAHCLIATDDEAYTFNRRVNRMAPIQEHNMILKAIRHGVSEERIANILKVDVTVIQQKRDLLTGICKEAAEILKNRQVSLGVFPLLRKLRPMRQIEVADLLVATGNFSVPNVKALLAATHADMLVEPHKSKTIEGLTAEQIAKMEAEMEVLQRDLGRIEESHGNQVLNLVLARGYLARLLGNARVTRYLGQHHSDLLHELQSVSETSTLDS
jgi:ParB-like chromosome segregation protein Spo0J